MRKIFTICIAIFVLSQVSYSRIYQKVNYDKIEKELNYSKLVVKLNNIVNYDILFEITEKYKIEFYNYFKLKPKSELLFTKQFQDKQGIEIPDLRTYFYFDLSSLSPDSSIHISNLINSFSEIDIAYFEPHFVPPSTPDFTSKQIYLTPSEIGLGYNEIKNITGANGDGISYCDLEYSTIWNHEDFDFSKINVVNPNETFPFTIYQDHGAAVLGIACGERNNFGISGMINNAKIFIAYPCYSDESCQYNVAQALVDATEVLEFGDVLLIEQQTNIPYPQNYRLGPIEYYDANFDAILVAANKGIIVVEAGGNGSMNLDSNILEGKFDKQVRNSGALMIGAGSQGKNDIMSFSPYGERIDLFANGQGIYSAGYGDVYREQESGKLKDYTGGFSGTSGASALIAPAITSIQGIHFALIGKKLGPEEMRDLLYETGTNSISTKKIGKMPNLKAAYNLILEKYTNIKNEDITDNKIEFNQIGENLIKITNWNSQMIDKKLDIYDYLGRRILTFNSINFSEINLDDFDIESGVYFIISNNSIYKFLKF